jgi:hypothetical protein
MEEIGETGLLAVVLPGSASRRPRGCQLGPDASLEAWIRLKLNASNVQGKRPGTRTE